ncbi:beta-galactosidase family protein [Microbacterium sp.]|uniref:glycoside hydrolase family 35 protein n=1 Tax=Microbacterium sp. TaxID=51671 RepID=UPI0026353F86|nr:beta-galactosidase family protein [Microbacterium sp.]MCV0335740.1 beta-galactosidase [Microbacterium sp.]MCV0377287.1 beta-galactosidase [Microbacterium sp.]MCV0391629.1 beta-galactosidase [Microbacterium sp.]MCV0419870.1 beta-galactosidase [Microbacterium sp.]MCV0423594.1 beta-galactosidase [Microbacterium sp.]
MPDLLASALDDSSVAVDAPAAASPIGAPTLTWRDGEILRDGAAHRILAGSIHYFRVHPDQWEDRLRRLAAMGANTVDTYVAWNFHERVEGDARFDGWRDIERFIRLAGDVGLDVFLRPSPYICAEWSNGGIPFWLSGRVTALRTSDADFLAAVDAWYDALIPRLAPLQAAHGGPIVAIQIENEYGSFGSDSAYLAHLRDGLRRRGMVEMLTTADGITGDMIEHGSVPGAMATFTFGTGVARAVELRREGDALMCSELWGGWFDHWGERHHVRSAASTGGTIAELLAAGGSVSLYMAHGGTNFGLWNGANHDQVLQPTVTSYDSDAPIGEDGTLNEKFHALRSMFAPFHAGELPPIPADPQRQSAATAPLEPRVSLGELIATLPVTGDVSPRPRTFEELGAEDGLVAYQADVSFPAEAVLTIDGLHDRAVVSLDGLRLGVLERDGDTSLSLPVGGGAGRLTIVVESLGRINYGPYTGEGKGIMRGVMIGRRLVNGWTHRLIPQDAPAVTAHSATTHLATPRSAASGLPADASDGLAVASFDVAEPLDAWLAFPAGSKGMVWLNGFLLGRYWKVGPQETLYAPAPLWKVGRNEIVVLDTDGLGSKVEIREEPSFGETEEFIGS